MAAVPGPRGDPALSRATRWATIRPAGAPPGYSRGRGHAAGRQREYPRDRPTQLISLLIDGLPLLQKLLHRRDKRIQLIMMHPMTCPIKLCQLGVLE